MNLNFGLLGKKLGHSFSQAYFTNKFREENIPGTYQNFELPSIDDFPDLLRLQTDLRGLNVTLPYKTEVIPFLDDLSEISEKVGAVNTIRIENGTTKGFNTDVIGFRDSLMEFYDEDPGGKALILGTGGASKAVHYVLMHFFQFDEVCFASRNPSQPEHIAYGEINEVGLQDYQLIVNATPVGMYPEQGDFPDLPYETLGRKHYLYDLVYNPDETEFLKKGRLRLCKVTNGMDMLIRQAEASWRIWTE